MKQKTLNYNLRKYEIKPINILFILKNNLEIILKPIQNQNESHKLNDINYNDFK